MDSIQSLIAEDMRAIDDVIRRHLSSEVDLVRRVATYIVGAGGKRLRPALVVLSARSLGYSGKHHYSFAAVVEFIHTATLLHDDVVDGSKMRRGRAAANSLFGNVASVLVGDFLYSRAFELMLDAANTKAMGVLARATTTIAEGEVMQLMNCHDPNVDELCYLQVIQAKTAKLFEAAAQLGAVLAGASPEQEQAMAEYGLRLGTAFQLVDDVLDYSGDRAITGKNIGDDLAEGKSTLPLIYAMKNGTRDQIEIIQRAIKNGGTSDFNSVLLVVRETQALEYCQKKAHDESAAAVKALSSLSHSNFKDSLIQLADFAVTRTH